MVRAIARRLATGAVTLLLVTAIVFALAAMSTGSSLPGESVEDASPLTPEQRAEIRALYHFDEPLHVRYGMWLQDLLRGDLGRSFHDRRPVAAKIAERLPATLALNAAALLLMILVSVPLGALAASSPGSLLDRAAGSATYALYSIPVFWAALLLQLAFAIRLGWLPLYGTQTSGMEAAPLVARLHDRLAHFVLPTVCLAYPGFAYLSRFVRGILVDNAAAESARAARARGLAPSAIVIRHGFRQAAVPLLTLAGFLLPRLVGGSVIVETIFAIPGLGHLFVGAMFQRDIPVVMGLTLLSGAATLGGVVAADLLYAVADPRVRRA